ncbi:LAFA_0B01838g1_1 [Lachancea sp. 'fantastica']|nr:LAFA_0B01838g1_1 [Lachancea sp. 'fantastica']
MGIIRRKKREPRLTLKIHALQAHNITVENSGCNPICVAISNGKFSRTAKQRNTSSPSWNQVLKLKLPQKATSEYVRIVVYDFLSNAVDDSAVETLRSQEDASRSYDSSSRYLYLGEVRLSLRDIFRRKDQPTSYNFLKSAAWYPLFNRNSLKFMHHDMQDAPPSLATGQIQLAVSLSCTRGTSLIKAFNEWISDTSFSTSSKRPSLGNKSFSKVAISDLPSSSTTVDEATGARNTPVDDDDDESATDFEEIIQDDPDVDEASGGYGDINDDDADDEDFDVEEIDDDENMEYDGTEYNNAGTGKYLELPEFEDPADDSNDLSSTDDVDSNHLDMAKVATALDEYDVVLSRSDLDVSVPPTTSRTPSIFTKGGSGDTSDTNSISTNRFLSLSNRRRRPHRSRRGMVTENYELSKEGHATGVIFMDIESIVNLPALKNKFSKTYMMDPFVIVAFGRRVFKTSCKKHSLNPTFNERLAFEVFPSETNFSFHFKVIDKDSFSYHDKVASGDMSWSELIQKQTGRHHGDDWTSVEIPLNFSDSIDSTTSEPVLNIQFKFAAYSDLKKHFWERALNKLCRADELDLVDVSLLMEKLGTFSYDEINDFFYHFNKSPWSHDVLTKKELVTYLQFSKGSSGFKGIKRCPLCSRRCKTTKRSASFKLLPENDLITHFSICSSSEDKRRMLRPSYVSSDFATKRWFSKFLIKLTYGKYALGSNNANILVQDRDSGIVLEEKISAHVRLGIRIIYNAKGTQSKKFKNLLKNQSIKQGKKFDSPASVKQIIPFIKFHSLDLSECEETPYGTFNEFFFRKLKPGSRSPEVDDPRVLLSPADSRCTVFSTIKSSKEIWIKGRNFTLAKLTGDYHPEIFNDASCSIGIFRLAPQDYHRFHSPCNGVVGKPLEISGEYYTVNPMAVRTELDVFGENVRTVLSIHSPEFGTILCIAVGAMMVGSIIFTCKEGQTIERGQELGYFKFGGSTILLVIPSQDVVFDTDLLQNSCEQIETLVKVGMSVGHTTDVKEHKREKHVPTSEADIDRIKRTISVSEEAANHIGNVSWEFRDLQKRLGTRPEIANQAEVSDPTEAADDLELSSIIYQ